MGAINGKTPEITREVLFTICEYLAQTPVIAQAVKAVGYHPNHVYRMLKQSRDGNPKYLVAWPDPDGEPLQFCEAVVLAQRAHLMNLRGRLMRDVDVGVPRVLRTPQGDIVWEKDPALLAEWGGDTIEARESAERLGGVFDYPYKHRKNAQGKLERVETIVYDPAPGALRIHAARATLAGWNPSNVSEVDNKHSGKVLIMQATKQGDATPPPYAHPADTGVSELKRDLMQRLEDLRERQARGEVSQRRDIVPMNRDRSDDPVERVGDKRS